MGLRHIHARLRAARARRETDVLRLFRRRYPNLEGTGFVIPLSPITH